MTDTEKLAAEYPHIDALSRGCMSGKPTDWPQFQPECARIMGQLALAMEAIEEADGIVSQTFFPHDEPGVKWCECCHRPVRDDGKLTHKGNCDLARYLELRKKLEETK